MSILDHLNVEAAFNRGGHLPHSQKEIDDFREENGGMFVILYSAVGIVVFSAFFAVGAWLL